jgi:hypothetical protein
VVKTRLEPIEFGTAVKHFVERKSERNAPPEMLQPFRSDEWELVTVEALESNGKWFSAGWRRRIGGRMWFLAFGRSGDTSEVITVFPTTDHPLAVFKNGPEVVRPENPFFGKVERVNRALMEEARLA